MSRSAVLIITAGLLGSAASAEDDAAPEPSRMTSDVPAKAVCSQQFAPQYPRAALHRGESGIVVARVRVINGAVAEILSLEGPEVFYPAVAFALGRYKCQADPVIAWQEFKFVLEKSVSKGDSKFDEPTK